MTENQFQCLDAIDKVFWLTGLLVFVAMSIIGITYCGIALYEFTNIIGE